MKELLAVLRSVVEHVNWHPDATAREDAIATLDKLEADWNDAQGEAVPPADEPDVNIGPAEADADDGKPADPSEPGE